MPDSSCPECRAIVEEFRAAYFATAPEPDLEQGWLKLTDALSDVKNFGPLVAARNGRVPGMEKLFEAVRRLLAHHEETRHMPFRTEPQNT